MSNLGEALQRLMDHKGETVEKRPAKARLADDQKVAEAVRRRAAEVAAALDIAADRSVAKTVARETLFLDRLSSIMDVHFPKGKLVIPTYHTKKKKPIERILNVLWSDLHFHSLLDPREVPIAYGPQEEARRLAYLCLQAAEYKIDHRDETELVINLAGDIIQNQLHDQRDGAPLAEQVSAALFLLVQAVGFLAGQFRKVTVHCTPGNHGRNTARHHDRATHQKWDSIENMLYYSLKVAFRDHTNVTVNVYYTPSYTYSAFGANVFVTHGDTVFKPGNPSENINVGNIRKQINEINSARKDSNKISVFCVGHVHTGCTVALPGGVYFMSNGALVPSDPFAQSIGIVETATVQQMWESVPGHVIGDSRMVVVDQDTDRDESLDKIVKPFTGF